MNKLTKLKYIEYNYSIYNKIKIECKKQVKILFSELILIKKILVVKNALQNFRTDLNFR